MEYNSIQLLKSLTTPQTIDVNKKIGFVDKLILAMDKANSITNKLMPFIPNPSITKFEKMPSITPPITEVISKEIVKHIHTSLKYVIEYNINYPNIQTFTILFYVTTKPSKKDLIEYSQRLYVVLNTISFFIVLMKIKNSNKRLKYNHQNIYFFMTNLKKLLPSHKTELEQYHVNTGYTAPHQGASDIVIYRKEEWYKVFIHEYVHNHHLDFSSLNSSFSKLTKKIYNINNDILFSEAMSEIWALSVNILMISYLFKKYNMFPELHNVIPFERTKKGVDYIFQYLLNAEIYFSIIQTKKILNYLNINYNHLFDKSKRVKFHNDNTNVCSYYLIKTIYIYFFIETEYFLTLSNKKTTVQTFERMATHPHIIHLLNEKIPSDVFYTNSLKMCALEIK